jgi:hypothetical protein
MADLFAIRQTGILYRLPVSANWGVLGLVVIPISHARGDDGDILSGEVSDSGEVAGGVALGSTRAPPTPRQQAPALRKLSAVVKSTPPVGMSLTWGSGPRRALR